jgi:hypothetical protein
MYRFKSSPERPPQSFGIGSPPITEGLLFLLTPTGRWYYFSDRGRFMFHRPPIILNPRVTQPPIADQPIDIALTLATADLKARFIDIEKGIVRYRDIRGSEAFERYKALAGELQSFNLMRLQTREARLSFWINIYNSAVIHGVIELGLRKSVKEFRGFFDRVAYEIGGHRFSLNDIEHGILRGNRRHPYGLFKPFRKGDPRIDFSIVPVDSRVHFALVCGARSCPPIGFYEAEQIDFQLQLAATSFINSPQVKVAPREESVRVSMIFKWYKVDFGGSDGLLIDTLLGFLDDGDAKTFLRENRDRIRIKYLPYDWNLNE